VNFRDKQVWIALSPHQLLPVGALWRWWRGERKREERKICHLVSVLLEFEVSKWSGVAQFQIMNLKMANLCCHFAPPLEKL
jgi:hypothetical protein